MRLRVITDEPAPGVWNMAVDRALLDSVEAGHSDPTLRFYGWRPACLSLGYFQSEDLVDWAACADNGVDVVRRPTGGRAILHDRELTYSLALPLSLLSPASSVLHSYLHISRALLAALRALGVPATLAPETSVVRAHGPACFDQPSSYEILLGGRKLVGSAQVRRRTALLQHGSILLEPQLDELLSCLALNAEQREGWRVELARSMGGLSAASTPIRLDDLRTALTAAFADALGCTPVKSGLSQAELEEVGRLAEKPPPDGAVSPSSFRKNTTRTR